MTVDGVRILGGKYEVQHVVGEGAYGLVMKCKLADGSGKHVAIKSFKIEVRESSNKAGRLEHLLREVYGAGAERLQPSSCDPQCCAQYSTTI